MRSADDSFGENLQIATPDSSSSPAFLKKEPDVVYLRGSSEEREQEEEEDDAELPPRAMQSTRTRRPTPFPQTKPSSTSTAASASSSSRSPKKRKASDIDTESIILSSDDDDDDTPPVASGSSPRKNAPPSPKKPKTGSNVPVDERDLPLELDEIDPDAEDVALGLPMRSLASVSLVDDDGNSLSLLDNPRSSGLKGLARPIHLTFAPGDDTSHSAWTALGKLRELKVDKEGLWVRTSRAWYVLKSPAPSFAAAFVEVDRLVALFAAAQSLGFSQLRDEKDLKSLVRALETYNPTKPLVPPLGKRDAVEHFEQLRHDLTKAETDSKATFLSATTFLHASRHFPHGALKQPPETAEANEEALEEEDEIRLEIIDHMRNHRERFAQDFTPVTVVANSERPGWPGIFDKISTSSGFICAGDCVAIEPDNDKKAEGEGKFAPWFARIKYFFMDDEGLVLAHLQWFIHGSDVMFNGKDRFGKSANPRELYLTNDCGDHEALSIIAKVVVGWQKGNAAPNHGYFYRYLWDKDERRFDDAHKLQRDGPTPLRDSKGKPSCPCCERRLEDKGYAIPQWVNPEDEDDLAFEYHETIYHIGDDVAIFMGLGCVFEIGRITAVAGAPRPDAARPDLFKNSHVTVRYYRRLPDLTQDSRMDSKLLVLTNVSQAFAVSSLKGKAVVRSPSEFEAELQQLGPNPSEEEAEAAEAARERATALARLEYLKTAGNFLLHDRQLTDSTSKKVDKILARREDLVPLSRAEFLATGCQSCKDERENRDTFEATSEPLTAIDLFAGPGGFSEGTSQAGIRKVTAVEFDSDAARVYRLNHPDVDVRCEDVSTYCEELSKQTEEVRPKVNIVCASPPCCPHSGANRHARADDDRIPLALVVPSFAELVDADYIFSVTWKVIRADAFGVPQTRDRLILVATRLGRTMADLPLGGYLPRSSATGDHQDGSAMHAGPVFGDLIGDLPCFEYGPVDTPLAPPPPDRNAGYAQYSIQDIHGVENNVYPHPAITPYQEALRLDHRGDLRAAGAPLTSHVERISHVPPGGNHRDLPPELSLTLAKDGGERKKNWFARIDPGKAMATLITQMDWNGGSHGPYLHPFQNRLITVREALRAMGFPDAYSLDPPGAPLSTKAKYKLAGNAVVPAVAFAVARCVTESRWRDSRVEVKVEQEEEK
ncbi:hypothetical protein RQP46_001964 [Phenoliferia psychrophenolica]